MTALRDIGEGGLLKLILPHLSMRGGDLLVGPGEDDAAAWSDPPGGTTVATVDAFVEGVHFDRRWLRVEEIGWRALALTLGDLACKGARPTYGLVSVSVPDSWTAEDVVGLYMGMSGLAGDVGLRLAGGDTTSAPRHACLAVTVLGRPAGAVVPRSAARPGWSVAVTGRLG
ncbi:MAG: thiamine-phosphate kinase, partial [Candidatus Dormibacteraceae bacterium]